METLNCHSIKESLIDHLREGIGVASFENHCVITLPIKTLDDRYVDITIERKLSDYFLVHDAGKSLSELFVQGVSLTDATRKHLEGIARANGVELSKDMFVIGCTHGNLERSILAVSQCAIAAMLELISHQPVVEEEPISSKISRSLKKWQPQFNKTIERGVHVAGRRFPHSFDFVSFPSDAPAHKTTAIRVLTTAYKAYVQAERYAFLVLDIENTPFDAWSRLAVISRAETWPIKYRKMVATLSQRTLEVESGQESAIEQELPTYMNQLA